MELCKQLRVILMKGIRKLFPARDIGILGEGDLVMLPDPVFLVYPYDFRNDKTGTALCPLCIEPDKLIGNVAFPFPETDSHCGHNQTVFGFQFSDVTFF
jgi:hypothetical protein